MKRKFLGYYRPSDDEFGQLWADARIIVDANVLLAVYGVSPSTRETLFRQLEAVQERLWIPHQFALEYQRNRVTKILEQVKYYEDALRALKAVLENHFRSRTHHPFVPPRVEKKLERICKDLLTGKDEQEALLRSDPHFSRTTGLFEGRVGGPFSDAELEKIYDLARVRYSKRIPPGFKDADKPEPSKFGDYVAWRQILDFVAKDGYSVILVTDDAKEDWWRMEGTGGSPRNYGPRPELIAEFRATCPGSFYMYSLDRFLEKSGQYVGNPVDPSAISELKGRRQTRAPDAAKPVEATPEPMAAKPITASTGQDFSTEGTGSDAPKLSDPEGEKPEEPE